MDHRIVLRTLKVSVLFLHNVGLLYVDVFLVEKTFPKYQT